MEAQCTAQVQKMKTKKDNFMVFKSLNPFFSIYINAMQGILFFFDPKIEFFWGGFEMASQAN